MTCDFKINLYSECCNIAEILLKFVLNTNQSINHIQKCKQITSDMNSSVVKSPMQRQKGGWGRDK